MADPTHQNKPRRIQRKRTKGWKMPPNTVYVGRPTRLGNPFSIRKDVAIPPNPEPMWAVVYQGKVLVRWDTKLLAAADAVDRYRMWRKERNEDYEIRQLLRGKEFIACWCPLDQPCHADVLLEIANG
jgi:hypothetical protein